MSTLQFFLVNYNHPLTNTLVPCTATDMQFTACLTHDRGTCMHAQTHTLSKLNILEIGHATLSLAHFWDSKIA